MANKKNIWLVGGETGGHIMPLIAVGQVLKHDASVSLTYLGAQNSIEQRLAKEYGFHFLIIPIGKLRRYLTLSSIFLNLRDSFRIMRGVSVSLRYIARYRPDLVFSKGGPVALPVALAAHLRGIPLVTHESDAVMGFTNRITARFAKVVLTAFPANYYPSSLASKIVTVGIPIREAFCRPAKNIRHKRSTILIIGGLQGSVAINEVIEPLLAQLLAENDVIHITGAYTFERFKQIKAGLPELLANHYTVIDFTTEIVPLMQQATVIISRASSAIFEIASLRKPMILIPLPSAANNHQVRNAEAFARVQAALVIRQENLTPSLLYEKITAVLDNTKIREQLREGTRHFISCDASKQVAKLLKQYAQE